MKIKVRVRQTPGENAEPIEITTEFIRLDAFLKLWNMVESGGMAKNVIQDGQVTVNSEVCTMRGKKLHDGDVVRFMGSNARVVGSHAAE
jgi:ribosome-associated protein